MIFCHVWKSIVKGTVATLPGRGRRSKLLSTARRFLRRQIEKNPRVTAKDLHKDLAAAGIEVSIRTVRRRLHAEGFHARTPRRTPLLTHKHKKARLHYAHGPRPKSFRTLFCGVTKQNSNFLVLWTSGISGGKRTKGHDVAAMTSNANHQYKDF